MPTKTKRTTPTNYLKNVAKSVAFSAVDVTKAMLPNASQFIDDNKSFTASTYASIRSPKQSLKRQVNTFQNSKMFQSIDYGIKNLAEDIRTGNFYNKEREEQDSAKFLGFDMGDLDDLSEYGLDSDWEAQLDADLNASKKKKKPEITDGDKKIAESVEKASAATANALAGVISSSAEYSTRAARANMGVLYKQNEQLFGGLHTDMTSLNTTMTAIHNLQSKVLTNIDKNMASYFEMSQKYQSENNAMLKEMLEMQRNMYKSAEEKDRARRTTSGGGRAKWSDISSGGMPNLEAYFKYVRSNIKSDLSMFDFGEDTNMMSLIMTAPLKFVSEMLVKVAIPNAIKDAAHEFDDTLSGVFGNMMALINNNKNQLGIIGKLARYFGIDSSNSTFIDTSKYEKGPVPWDGMSRKALMEVIPGYLSRMESFVTGGPELIYDYKNGRWIKMKEARNKLENIHKYAKDRALGGLKQDMRRDIEDNNDISADEMDEFNAAYDEFFEYLYTEKNGVLSRRDKPNKNKYPRLMGNNGKYWNKISARYFSLKGDKVTIRGKEYERFNRNKWKAASNTFEAKEMERSQIANADDTMRTYAATKGIGFDVHGSWDKGKFKSKNLLNTATDHYNNTVFDYLRNINRELAWQREYGFGGGGRRGRNRGRNGGGVNTWDQMKRIDLSATGERLERNSPTEAMNKRLTDFDNNAYRVAAQAIFNHDYTMLLNSNDVADCAIEIINMLIDNDYDRVSKLIEGYDPSVIMTFISTNFPDNVRNNQRVGRSIFIEKMRQRQKERGGRGWLNNILRNTNTGRGLWGAVAATGMQWIYAADKAVYSLFFENQLSDGNNNYNGFMDFMKAKFNAFWADLKEGFKNTFVEPIKAALGIDDRWKQRFKDEGRRIIGGVKNKVSSTFRGAYNATIGRLANTDPGAAKRLYTRAVASSVTSINDSRIRTAAKFFNIDLSGVTNVEDAKQAIADAYVQWERDHQPSNAAGTFVANGRPPIRNGGISSLTSGETIFGRFRNANGSISRRMMGRVKNTGVYRLASNAKGMLGFDVLPSDDSAKVFGGVGVSKKTAQYREDRAWDRFRGRTNAEGTVDLTTKDLIREAKANIPEMAAGGLIGGIISTLLGLMGGPLLGAAVGAGTSLLKRSKFVQNKMFGEVGADGERSGGIISKSVQDSVKKYAPDAISGGLLGVIPGLLTPLGPVGGILVGGAIGVLKNTEAFKSRFLGKQDKNGRNALGIGDDEKKIIQKMLPDALKGAGVGAVVGTFLGGPFGLLGNAALGAGLGILSGSEEFKNAILGEKDENGKRVGGIVGTIADAFEPLKDSFKGVSEKLAKGIDENIVQPLKKFMAPAIHLIPTLGRMLGGRIATMLNNRRAKGGKTLGTRIRNTVDRMGILGKPLGWAMDTTGKIITAPTRMLGKAGGWLQGMELRNDDMAGLTEDEIREGLASGKFSEDQLGAGIRARLNIGKNGTTFKDAENAGKMINDFYNGRGKARKNFTTANNNVNRFLSKLRISPSVRNRALAMFKQEIDPKQIIDYLSRNGASVKAINAAAEPYGGVAALYNTFRESRKGLNTTGSFSQFVKTQDGAEELFKNLGINYADIDDAGKARSIAEHLTSGAKKAMGDATEEDKLNGMLKETPKYTIGIYEVLQAFYKQAYGEDAPVSVDIKRSVNLGMARAAMRDKKREARNASNPAPAGVNPSPLPLNNNPPAAGGGDQSDPYLDRARAKMDREDNLINKESKLYASAMHKKSVSLKPGSAVMSALNFYKRQGIKLDKKPREFTDLQDAKDTIQLAHEEFIQQHQPHNIIGTILSGIAGGVKLAGSVASTAIDVGSNIVKGAGRVISTGWDLGKRIVPAIGRGIKGAVNVATAPIRGIAHAISASKAKKMLQSGQAQVTNDVDDNGNQLVVDSQGVVVGAINPKGKVVAAKMTRDGNSSNYNGTTYFDEPHNLLGSLLALPFKAAWGLGKAAVGGAANLAKGAWNLITLPGRAIGGLVNGVSNGIWNARDRISGRSREAMAETMNAQGVAPTTIPNGQQGAGKEAYRFQIYDPDTGSYIDGYYKISSGGKLIPANSATRKYEAQLKKAAKKNKDNEKSQKEYNELQEKLGKSMIEASKSGEAEPKKSNFLTKIMTVLMGAAVIKSGLIPKLWNGVIKPLWEGNDGQGGLKGLVKKGLTWLWEGSDGKGGLKSLGKWIWEGSDGESGLKKWLPVAFDKIREGLDWIWDGGDDAGHKGGLINLIPDAISIILYGFDQEKKDGGLMSLPSKISAWWNGTDGTDGASVGFKKLWNIIWEGDGSENSYGLHGAWNELMYGDKTGSYQTGDLVSDGEGLIHTPYKLLTFIADIFGVTVSQDGRLSGTAFITSLTDIFNDHLRDPIGHALYGSAYDTRADENTFFVPWGSVNKGEGLIGCVKSLWDGDKNFKGIRTTFTDIIFGEGNATFNKDSTDGLVGWFNVVGIPWVKGIWYGHDENGNSLEGYQKGKGVAGVFGGIWDDTIKPWLDDLWNNKIYPFISSTLPALLTDILSGGDSHNAERGAASTNLNTAFTDITSKLQEGNTETAYGAFMSGTDDASAYTNNQYILDVAKGSRSSFFNDLSKNNNAIKPTRTLREIISDYMNNIVSVIDMGKENKMIDSDMAAKVWFALNGDYTDEDIQTTNMKLYSTLFALAMLMNSDGSFTDTINKTIIPNYNTLLTTMAGNDLISTSSLSNMTNNQLPTVITHIPNYNAIDFSTLQTYVTANGDGPAPYNTSAALMSAYATLEKNFKKNAQEAANNNDPNALQYEQLWARLAAILYNTSNNYTSDEYLKAATTYLPAYSAGDGAATLGFGFGRNGLKPLAKFGRGIWGRAYMMRAVSDGGGGSSSIKSTTTSTPSSSSSLSNTFTLSNSSTLASALNNSSGGTVINTIVGNSNVAKNASDTVSSTVAKAVTGGTNAGAKDESYSVYGKNYSANEGGDDIDDETFTEAFWRARDLTNMSTYEKLRYTAKRMSKVVQIPTLLVAHSIKYFEQGVLQLREFVLHAAQLATNALTFGGLMAGGNVSSTIANNADFSQGYKDKYGINSTIEEINNRLFGSSNASNNTTTTALGKFGRGFVKQTDPRIANKPYTARGDKQKQTIGDSGCGPAAAVNAVLASYGRGSSPLEGAVDYAMAGGYKEVDGGTYPEFFSDYFADAGLNSFTTTNRSMLMNSIRAGNPTVLMGQDRHGVSASTPYGAIPHYVTATGVDRNGHVIIQDPESRYDNQLYSMNDVMKKTSFGVSALGSFGLGKKRRFGRGRKFGRGKFGRGRYSKIVWVGDSRSVGMASAISGKTISSNAKLGTYTDTSLGVVWIAAGAWAILNMEKGWPNKGGSMLPYIDAEAAPGTAICIWMGTNDVWNPDQRAQTYISKISEWARGWQAKGAAVYFVSCGPLGYGATQYNSGSVTITNEKIASFNNTVASGLASAGVGYIDIYSSMLNNPECKSGDKIHYNASTYKLIWAEAMRQLENGTAGVASGNTTIVQQQQAKVVKGPSLISTLAGVFTNSRAGMAMNALVNGQSSSSSSSSSETPSSSAVSTGTGKYGRGKWGRANTYYTADGGSGSSSLSGQDLLDANIWWVLKNQQGLTDAGAAGVMGNMTAESARNPKRVQGYSNTSSFNEEYTNKVDSGAISRYDFIHSGPNGNGYGLVQFTSEGEKSNLYDSAKANGTSVGEPFNQINSVFNSIKSNKKFFSQFGEPYLLDTLQTTNDVYQAARAFVLLYERCRNFKSSSVHQLRANYAQQIYDKFKGTNGIAPNGVSGVVSNAQNGQTVEEVSTSSLIDTLAGVFNNSRAGMAMNALLGVNTTAGATSSTTNTNGTALAGAPGTAERMVSVALQEAALSEQEEKDGTVHNTHERNGDNNVKYNTWYYGHEVSGEAYPWCAAFVTWCAEQSGNLANGALTKTAGCGTEQRHILSHGGHWVNNKADVRPGDITYDNGSTGAHEHTGIVVANDNGTIYRVDGNYGNKVRKYNAAIDGRQHVYVRPNYTASVSGMGKKGNSPLAKFGKLKQSMYGRGIEGGIPEFKTRTIHVNNRGSSTGSTVEVSAEDQRLNYMYKHGLLPRPEFGRGKYGRATATGEDNYTVLINAILQVLMTIATNTDQLNVIVTLLNEKLGTGLDTSAVTKAAAAGSLKATLQNAINMARQSEGSAIDGYANQAANGSITMIMDAMSKIATE